MQEPAESKPITSILSLSQIFDNLQLIVPGYQRPYKWGVKQVLQLLEDLEACFSEGLPFRAGTLILHKNKGSHDIVDGQQRLVTLTLLLHALQEKRKLPLLSHQFRHIDSKNNILNNYNAIHAWLENTAPDKQLFCGYILQRCSFVIIILHYLEEAFQLFDAQNARGKALEPYDLLRLFICVPWQMKRTNNCFASNAGRPL